MNGRRIISVCMLFCLMLGLCACSMPQDKEYVEVPIALADSIAYVSDIVKTEEGRLKIGGANEELSEAGIWESDDNGKTWEKTLDFNEILEHNKTVENITINLTENKEGLLAIIYEEDVCMYYFDMEGHISPVKSDVVDKIIDLETISFGYICDDIIFCLTRNEEVYLVNMVSGEMTELELSKDKVLGYYITNNCSYILTDKGIECCDIHGNVEILEDVAIQNIEDLVSKINMTNGIGFSIFFRGETPIIYIADDLRILKLEEDNIQTIIEKTKTSLAEEYVFLQKFVLLDDDNVMMLAQKDEESIMAQFILTQKESREQTIKIYSLENDQSLQEIVKAYQKKNPKINVILEVGMEDDGVQRQDAITRLNGSLISGSGPDILVLDGLPYEKYAAQGMLSDMTTFALKQVKENDVFSNITSAYCTEDKQYGVPLFFTMITMSSLNQIGELNTLEDFLTYVEACMKNEDIPVYETWSYDQVVSILYRLYVTDMLSEGKVTDSARIEEFYSVVHKIYELEDMKEVEEEGKGFDNISLTPSGYNNFDLVMTGEVQMALDYIFHIVDFEKMLAIRQNNMENKVLEKDGSILCVPRLSLGICSKNSSRETAEDFVSFALSYDVQKEIDYAGLYMNKTAMQEKLADMDSETLQVETVDFSAIELPFEKLTNQEMQDWISNLETSSFIGEADQQIFRIIMGEMPNVAQGKISEKDAAEEACRKINLYLDE
ncbi:MAG: extracellular solute-binding protein [Clostridium sp.]|nr:extracellular solute-binding protein [Clostridium sp.]